MLQGVPIEGQAGVGYRFGAGFDLPPMMFGVEEAKALVAAVRLAQPWLDASLALAAEGALGKMLSAFAICFTRRSREFGTVYRARRIQWVDIC
jgi:predicted DNA-binding transcriptional regulator YafY